MSLVTRQVQLLTAFAWLSHAHLTVKTNSLSFILLLQNEGNFVYRFREEVERVDRAALRFLHRPLIEWVKAHTDDEELAGNAEVCF